MPEIGNHYGIPRLAASLLPLFAIAAACSGAPEGADAGPPRAEIGVGSDRFIPVTSGDSIRIVYGPQGGQHLVVHARMRGLSPGDPRTPGLAANPRTSFRVFALDEPGGERRVDAALPSLSLGYVSGGDGWLELPTGRNLVLADGEAEGLEGMGVRIELAITDAGGRRADAAIDLRAISPVDP